LTLLVLVNNETIIKTTTYTIHKQTAIEKQQQ
jgi:hypothetical protein